MWPQRLLISFVLVLFAVTAIFLCNASTVRAADSVTWTNLVSANTSGSSLTPTAAGGHAESSQTITSGNGSLVVSAWSSGDGNWASFGLTNGTFTGDHSQIKYGWLTYGTVANCRQNGDSLNNLINVAQGDTLEVRINGTTIEYYHNATLVYSLTNQTLSYPYRAAATFSSSTSPPISSATMTGVSGGSSSAGVTWTNLVNANTSGSSLTPTAAGGHAESSQTITSGNGSLVVSAWSSGDGNWASFGLTNGTFTGDHSQIKYGWLTYGTVANCRQNGDSLNNLINVAQGDTLEVRINGTTIEYYHNATLVYSLTGQTLSYPYRAAATFSASTSPPISSATMTEVSGGSSSAGVTWTNLLNATSSGSSLTPTAAGGHAESSQSIASGNGALVVSAWPSYPDGNYGSFGLTNGTFTGSAAEIKYGWLSYGSVANCRLNGDSLNNLINVAQGDTLEVRINGTTIEYYHNATLVYSLTSQTLSYPYRAAATFSSSTAPAISSATITGTSGGSGPSIKTDRAVYLEPPLPTLPAAGGKFNDAVFGTQIMRVTDATDYPAPGCSTFYSQWPTFNADNTRILIRCGDSGDMKIKAFDPVNFTLGSTLRTSPTLPGGVALEWQGAMWSRTDPDLIFVHVSYYNVNYPATGMKLYTYRPSTDTFALIKDFAPTLAPGQPDYLFEMHVDANDEIFTLMHKRVGQSEPIYYIVWKRSTNQVLLHIPNTLASFGPKEIANTAVPDKSGRWIFFPYNLDSGPPQIGDPRIKVWDRQTNTWQTIYWTGADDSPAHGDVGTGFMVGHGNFSGAANYRPLTDVHNRTLLFDYKNVNGVTDWSNDQHMTLYADNENWVMMGLYDDPDLDSYPSFETGAFEDEIMQYSTTDPQKFRRLLHHRSEIKNTSDTNGYWAIPKPTISRDGRFIAFTSNWEDSGRYDLFIARIEPAP